MSEPPESAPSPRRRRPRYPGTHPRRFEERYKERSPERYPGMSEHVRAKGRTPAGQHVPILVEEVLAVLAPRPGERGVDATLGFGGHARHLLQRLTPGGHLLALDADPIELPRTEARLRALGHGPDVLTTRRTNHAGLLLALGEVGWPDGADLILADLGLSSMQLDDPERGFTFAADGPLDMRMNPGRGPTAAAWLERTDVHKLARILSEHADEPHAELIARSLAARAGTLTRTRTLADAVRSAVRAVASADAVEDSVRRTFQAIRIAVNEELDTLDALLRALPLALRPGGRVAVLSFHSGEDRRVKKAFSAGLRDGIYARLSPEVIRAGPGERRDNPRSRPAKLRWAVRAGVD